MTANTAAENRARSRRLAWLAGALLLAAAVAAAWHAAAYQRYRDASGGGETLAASAASAESAARMEPWNREFARRALVQRAWARGDALLASGDYNAAVDELRTAYRADVGNAELLALFRRAQRTQALETVKKAHLQHAHEGPGGTLRPEDIER